ncbi:serine hydrolase domain-containing protein [Cryptosporangium japonicum]|uniref:Serine hydrolase domain-containing protein n=1 Tax=Cryptosporangium japonicum TaxID=80872 RepID=A0ABP3DFB9_9ACTN
MKILLALVLSLTPAPPAALQRDADAIRALGVVGVQAQAADGPRVTTATSGVADRTTGEPMPADGHLRIASTRKTMTAVVALQLVAEERLSLDDPVDRWLPDVPAGITVRHLLQNTSGLHDDHPGYTTPAEYREQRDDVHTRDELVARSLKHPLDFPPGTKFGYSNTAALLADALVERVTGRTLPEEITDRIVRPLGLTGTTWPGASPIVPSPSARAYQHFSPTQIVDVTEQVPSDPDSIISTTRDLDRFFRALLSGRLLGPAQLAEMQKTVPLDEATGHYWPGGRYGLGLVRRPLPCGGYRWGHDGGDGGFILVTGVTGDGRRSALVSMTSAMADSPDHVLAQQRAADRLVDNALCA